MHQLIVISDYTSPVCADSALHNLSIAPAQRAHLLYVTDGSGADLGTVDTGAQADPRTGTASAPAATASTSLQLVNPVINSAINPVVDSILKHVRHQGFVF